MDCGCNVGGYESDISRTFVFGEPSPRQRKVWNDVARGQQEAFEAAQKIIEGKINKYFGDYCLMEQPFVKNPDQTIQDLLTAQIAKLGENMMIKRFVRFQVGE